jgi:hypothetical protein
MKFLSPVQAAKAGLKTLNNLIRAILQDITFEVLLAMVQLTLATPSIGNHGLPQEHLKDFNLKFTDNPSLL